MSTLTITLAAWSAWEQHSTTPESWSQRDASGIEQSHAGLAKAERIPAMLRRRLGSLGKAAIASGENLIADINEPMPTVFCSQHGDLKRTLSLLDSLSHREPLSPTQFSLSVHNAIAGIYAIAREDHSASTAISCAQDDVSSALLETQLILNEQRSQYALCLVHDEPIPERYSTSALPINTYAASFLLCAENSNSAQQLELCIAPDGTGENTATHQPSALTLIDFLNSRDQDTLDLNRHGNYWRWEKVSREQHS